MFRHALVRTLQRIILRQPIRHASFTNTGILYIGMEHSNRPYILEGRRGRS